MQRKPRFSGILLVAVLMVLVLLFVSLSPLVAASASKHVNYSDIYYYFQNQQVTSYRLDRNTNTLEMWLKEGKIALPEDKSSTADLPTGGLLTGVYSSDDDALPSNGGTVYLLGRDDPYASASPLMTAVAEHVLDTALSLAARSPYGRVTPSFLACLDELPSTTPLPTLRTRMANERALGLSFVYAAQTWRQMVVCYGEDEARSLFGLTNTIIVFGGGKDIHFYKEVSDLIGGTRISRQTLTDGPGGYGTSLAGEDVPILRPEHIRLLPERQALVVAENAPPLIARLRRCIDGRPGRGLLIELAEARRALALAREQEIAPEALTRRAIESAQHAKLHPELQPRRRSAHDRYNTPE